MVDISKLKFRHLYGELYKKKFANIQPSTNSSESCGIKGNPHFFAFNWKTNGGGALAFFQNENYQKQNQLTQFNQGHQGQILDFDFYPFNDYQIATLSEDCSIKFWKKVQLITFQHVSANVIASASVDQTVKLWNLEKQTGNLLGQLIKINNRKLWTRASTIVSTTKEVKKNKINNQKKKSLLRLKINTSQLLGFRNPLDDNTIYLILGIPSKG